MASEAGSSMWHGHEKYQLVGVEKAYNVCTLLKHNVHHVVWLPPYMCNINPIELEWSKIKRKIKKCYGCPKFNSVGGTYLTTAAIQQLQRKIWLANVKQVTKV
ncbi:hypothetical protein J6590_041019 [Homalodisca vitripennis]|nr:hypothetical protein J6590_041019 [Homalodisca vitripennis]